MPRFYFNVHDGRAFPDDEGTDLPDVDAAKKAAVRTAAQLLSDGADTFWNGDEWRMDVTDAGGLILFSLTFYGSEAAALRAERPT